MSERFPGGIISKTAPVPTGPYETGTAPGVWTLDQQAAYVKQGIWPLAGNAVPYIEDVFSTYLYTGNGSTQTITNGIDLSGKGGLVWFKTRSPDIGNYHALFDTVRGNASVISSNATDAANAYGTPNVLTSFNSTGFSLGSDNYGWVNTSGNSNVSWTFRKQPKFFDCVTYTGDGVSNRAISHNLGSIPGCILLKRTDSAASWFVYHRATGGTPQDNILQLNTTDAVATSSGYWGTTPFTDTQFRVSGFGGFNASGGTYVAYLFAHDAGGFGLTGTDNVISCGSYTGNGSTNGPVVTLGYEAQWVMIKSASASGNWSMFDNMRGVATASAAGNGLDARLLANDSAAEDSGADFISFTSTGFQIANSFGAVNTNGDTYIYIAIRRGPMKTPTTGTSVLASVTRSGNSTQTVVTGASSPPDLVMVKSRNNATEFAFTDRLRGVTNELSPAYNFSEADYGANPTVSINMNGWTAPAGSGTFNQSGYTYVDYMFSRWPNVFDEVCYTSNYSANPAVNHNLGVVPELLIFKDRGAPGRDWEVYCPSVIGSTNMLPFNRDYSVQSVGTATTLTSTTFQQQSVQWPNAKPYVAYLFATFAGISKVGSYTGTGASQVINCGFTTGARWVMIKRTDSTGNWYVWDTARGMVSGTDPYLIMNDALAETNANYIFTSSTGFTIQSGVPAGINASGGTYIFLAIA